MNETAFLAARSLPLAREDFIPGIYLASGDSRFHQPVSLVRCPVLDQVAKAKAEEDARSAAVERAGKDKAEQQWPTISNMETLDDGRIASVRDAIITSMI